MFDRCIIVVADGARADVMRELLFSGRLPNIKKHLVDRGCFRTALTVFPSTTGPAHIPFVCGLHPGTANVPGYRWLCRKTHDATAYATTPVAHICKAPAAESPTTATKAPTAPPQSKPRGRTLVKIR